MVIMSIYSRYKEEMVVFCPISELQEQLYQEILDTEDAQLVLHADEICDCGSGKRRGRCCFMVKGHHMSILNGEACLCIFFLKKNEEGVSWEKLGFSYSTLLTKCANHLGLLLPSSTTSLGQREKVHNYKLMQQTLFSFYFSTCALLAGH